jgi:hypothetical protein
MFEWVYQLPVIWMALIIFAVTGIVTLGIHALVMALAARDRVGMFKGFAAGMLSPLGTIFGLLVGFLALQVWSDAQQAEEVVHREAGALRSVVIMSSSFAGPTERRIDTLIRQQIQEAVTSEWPAMAHQDAYIRSIPPPLVEAMQLVLAQAPQGEGQTLAQHELVRSLHDALDARRQRMLLSRSTINWVKWMGLGLEAALVLVAIAIIHSDNRAVAAVAMGIFAAASATAAVLIAAHARPFTGEISVHPDVLLQVMPGDQASDREQSTPLTAGHDGGAAAPR